MWLQLKDPSFSYSYRNSLFEAPASDSLTCNVSKFLPPRSLLVHVTMAVYSNDHVIISL